MVKILKFKRFINESYETSEDNNISGGLGDDQTLSSLCKKHNVSMEYLSDQFERGVQVESEHTNSVEIAKEIAIDHLTERPDYYIQLAKLEKNK